MYQNMFSKRNRNGKENSDFQSFGKKLEINCKPQFGGHKGCKSPSRADKGHKNYYDMSIEGENSSEKI